MFTHLHNHTEYSLLDGLSRIKPLVQKARELGMDSLAITDHGAMYGVVEFYSECKQAGIKPILGCEIYVARRSYLSKAVEDKSPFHLTLLAKNNQGYQNLIQLTTKAHLEGFYYKPRVDKDLLKQHGQGLIALSGCLNAEIPKLIAEERMEEALAACRWHQGVFDNFYLEIQRHSNVPELDIVNQGLIYLSQQTGIPLVATNDCHYIVKEDAPTQDILICIHTNTNIQDEKRLKGSDDSYYLKSPQEVSELFRDLPEAVANTARIAESCQVELEFGKPHLPEYASSTGEDPYQFLVRLCWEGLERRYPGASQAVRDRLSYELEVIRKTQFANYFLVVWDIASFVRSKGIFFGVRGSAAASLALYCLGVTDIDPLAYRLVFERFLNIERKEMPDIDMDFQDDRRDEVLAYVTSKYGRDHVAQIITFGTLGAKAAVRDVGRALAMPYADVDRVARLIPFKLHITLDEALESTAELKELYESDEKLRQLIDTAKRLEGVVRHSSTHAAGVVISKDPLTQYVPLQKPVRGEDQDVAVTQFTMEPIAKLGLLKMDFLGLANLTILDRAKAMVQRTRGETLDLRQIPLNDAKTFELLSSGETTGIFQLESSGMRRYIKELKPNSLSDISAMIALYRPGPMEQIDTFIKAKHGLAPVRYPHPKLKDILEETYGVIVYQDQVLLIAQAFAGYTLGEADVVRKAMGKKIPAVMRQERDKFIAGAKRTGFSQELAEEVFNLVEPFAGYAFNKAHSVSYALIAYWTAYLKANYSVEYMSAVLNSHKGEQDKVAAAVGECLRLGIPVLPPDVNHSDADFSVELHKGKPAIRFGLSAIKNVGEIAMAPLIEARRTGGAFASVEGLCRRVDFRGLNRRTLESLIKAGGLDSLGKRSALLANIDRVLALAQSEARLRESGQSTMFDLFGKSVPTPMASLELGDEDATSREKLAWEKELLGVYLSENPISALAFAASTQAIASRDQIDASMAGQRISLVGQVSGLRQLQTRDRRPFLAVTLDLLGGGIDVMVWPDALEKSQDLWMEGAFLWVVGRVRTRDEELSISCEEVKPYYFQETKEESIKVETDHSVQPVSLAPPVNSAPKSTKLRTLVVHMKETNQPAQDRDVLKEVLKLLLENPGSDRVALMVATNGSTERIDMPSFAARYSAELCSQLEAVLGANCVTIEE